MNTNVIGEFYNRVILEIVKPVIADVSEADYVAETFKLNGVIEEKQRPFVMCSAVEVKAKVLPFYGSEPVEWIFPVGPYPMPLKRIYTSPAPLVCENGVPTATEVTSLQIGY